MSLYGLASVRLRTDAEVVRWFMPNETEPEKPDDAPHETEEEETQAQQQPPKESGALP